MPTGTQPEPYWKRIKRLRQRLGITQSELFLRTGGAIDHSTIQAFEMEPKPPAPGKRARWRKPTADAFTILADALGVEPVDFPEY